ncbi:MAG: hypothetical protein ORN49_11785, partial [Rhodobacteraceae bacterium]|nr:hypothetical protein [Paracoccaceae bacterium]
RTGAIPPNRLLGLYSERKAAASGGVWTRVIAMQEFEAALLTRDPAAIAQTLPPVWAAMQGEQLESVFASLYGGRLIGLALDTDTSALAFRISLLSADYEKAALARKPADDTEAFLIDLARGLSTTPPASDEMGLAVQAAFAPTAALEAEDTLRLTDGHLGASLLAAMNLISGGAKGDLRSVTRGLVLLRKAGLESVARQAALELVLLERHG